MAPKLARLACYAHGDTFFTGPSIPGQTLRRPELWPLGRKKSAFKRVFDPLDLEIIDRVYEVAWAHVQAHQPNRDTASDGKRQEALRKKIFGVARIMGSGHIDFETLTEVVLAIPGRSMPLGAGDRHVLQRSNVRCSSRVQAANDLLLARASP